MELKEQAFLEKLFSLRRDAWECNAMGEIFSLACAAIYCVQECHQATVSVLPNFIASYKQMQQATRKEGGSGGCNEERGGGGCEGGGGGYDEEGGNNVCEGGGRR